MNPIFWILIITLIVHANTKDYKVGCFLTNVNDGKAFFQKVIEIAFENSNKNSGTLNPLKDKNVTISCAGNMVIGLEENINEAAIQMINLGGAEFIGFVGPYDSGAALGLTTLAKEQKKPFIAYAATSVRLTRKEFAYRVVPSDVLEVQALADMAFVLGVTDVVVLHSNTAFGNDGASLVVDTVTQKGIDYHGSVRIDGNEGMESALQKVKASGSKNVILYMSSSYDYVKLFQLVDDYGMNKSPWKWFSSESIQAYLRKSIFESFPNFKKNIHGVIFTSQEEKGFTRRSALFYGLQKEFDVSIKYLNEELPHFLTHCYDAALSIAYSLAHAIENDLDPTDGEQFEKSLLAVDFIGSTGLVSFDNNGDRIGLIYDLKNVQEDDRVSASTIGKWTLQESIYNLANKVQLPGEGFFSPNWIHDIPREGFKWKPSRHFGNSPSPREQFCMCLHEKPGKLVIFGGVGRLSKEMYKDLFEFSLKENYWSQIFSLSMNSPPARKASACEISQDELFIFGGASNFIIFNDGHTFLELAIDTPPPREATSLLSRKTGQGDDVEFILYGGNGVRLYNDMYRFDIRNSRWSQIIPSNQAPEPRLWNSIVYSEPMDSIFVFGGTVRNSFGITEQTSELWRFTFATLSWKMIETPDSHKLRRYAHSMVIRDSIMYMGMGRSENMKLNDFWSFDLAQLEQQNKGQWVNVLNSTMPSRYHSSLVRYEEDLIVFGGRDESGNYLGDMWQFSLLLQSAKNIHQNLYSPMGLTDFGYANVNYMMYVWGGVNFNRVLNSNQEMLVLNLHDLSWDEISFSHSPQERRGHSMTNIEDSLYVFGGANLEATRRYQDLWVFRTRTTHWEELNFPNPPSARYGHSSTGNGTHLFILGSDGEFDIHTFSIFENKWSEVFSSKDNHLRRCNSLFHQRTNSIFLIGCDNSHFVYQYHLHENEFSPFKEVPSNYVFYRQGAAFVRDDLILIFGGQREELVSNQLFFLNIEDGDFHPVELIPDLHEPIPRMLAGSVYFDDKFTVFGGTGSVDCHQQSEGSTECRINTLVHSIILGDTWTFHPDTVCSHSLPNSLIDPVCVHCARGSFERRGICIPCPRGTLKSEMGFDLKSCPGCPTGSYNDQLGAFGQESCLPCPFGTFQNETGQNSCIPCDKGEYCPIGAVSPLNQTNVQTNPIPIITQPPDTFHSSENFVWITMAIIFGILGIIGFVTFILMTLLYCFNIIDIRRILFFDKVYTTKHHVKFGVMRKKQTIVGAFFSVIAVYTMTAVGVFFIMRFYAGNNISYTRTLIPNTEVISHELVSDMVFEVEAVGYQGECSKPDTRSNLPFDVGHLPTEEQLNWAECSDQIRVSLDYIESRNQTLDKNKKLKPAKNFVKHRCLKRKISENVQSCVTQWVCKNCWFAIDSSFSKIRMSWEEENSFARSWRYKISSRTGYVRYRSTSHSKEGLSTIQGSFLGNEQTYFRGLNPTILQIRAIGTEFLSEASSVLTGNINFFDTGYHLDFMSILPGTESDHLSFSSHKTVHFEVELQESDSLLFLQRTENASFLDFCVSLSGQIVGIWASIGFVMIVLEKIMFRTPMKNELSQIEQDNIDEELEIFKLLKLLLLYCRHGKKTKKRLRQDILREKLLDDNEMNGNDSDVQLSIIGDYQQSPNDPVEENEEFDLSQM